MAVPVNVLFPALQEQHVVLNPRGNGWHTTLNGRKADLRRLASPADEYKLSEVRHLAAQLHLDKKLLKKHIPTL